MKLRLPLILASILLTAVSPVSALIETDVDGATTVVTGDETLSSSGTYTILKVGNVTTAGGSNPLVDGNQGNLTINAPAGTITTGKFYVMGQNNGIFSTTTIEEGTIEVTDAQSNSNYAFWIGANNYATAINAPGPLAVINGGTVNVTNSAIALGRWNTSAYLEIHGGSVTAQGIVSKDCFTKSFVTITGGTITLGSQGFSGRQSDQRLSVAFSGGTLGTYQSWSIADTVDLDVSGNGRPTFDISQGDTLTIDTVITGSGNGRLVKTGSGTLKLNHDNPDLGVAWELRGGTVNFSSDAVFGTASALYVAGNATLDTDASSFSKNISVENGATLTLKGNGSVAHTGSINLNGTGSLALDNYTVTFGSNANISGNILSLRNSSSITIDGGSLVLTYDINRFDDVVCIGPNSGNNNNYLTIQNQGVFTADKTWLSLGIYLSKGHMQISSGSRAVLAGVKLSGWGSTMTLEGNSTLVLGEGGIRIENSGRGSKDNIGLFTFQSGTIRFTADSQYDLNGTNNNFDAEGYFVLGNEGTHTFEVDSGKSVSMKGVISGEGGLIKTGQGTLSLTEDNTFTGVVQVRAGALGLASDTSLSAGVTRITITGNSSIITSSNTISKDFNVSNGARLSLIGREGYSAEGALAAAPVEYTGVISLNETGSLTLENGKITVASGRSISGNQLAIQANSMLLIDGGTVTMATDLTGITSLGVGSLSTSNGHSYLEVINEGRFNAANAALSLGISQDKGHLKITSDGLVSLGGVVMNGDQTSVTIDGGTLALGRSGITINNDPGIKTHEILFSSGTIQFTESNKISLLNSADDTTPYLNLDGSGDHFFEVATDKNASIDIVIGGTGGMTKTGAGRLTLAKANTFTGILEVREGTLNLTGQGHTYGSLTLDSAQDKTAQLVVSSGSQAGFGQVEMNGYGTTITIAGGVLSLGDSNLTINNDPGTRTHEIRFNSGTILFTGDGGISLSNDAGDTTAYVNLLGGGDHFFEVATGKNASIETVIGGTGGMIKTGGGTLILGRNNTFSGTLDIREGTLDLGAQGELDTGSVILHGGSAIQGNLLGNYGGSLSITGDDPAVSAVWGGDLNTSSLLLVNSKSTLTVDGNMTLLDTGNPATSSMSVTLDEVAPVMDPRVTLTSGHTLSLGQGSSIELHVTQSVLDTVSDGTVYLHLFNTDALSGLTEDDMPSFVWSRTDEVYELITDHFLSDGYIMWNNTEIKSHLITIDQGLSPDAYQAKDNVTYLGAKEDNVVFTEDKTYSPYTDGNYRLTNGLGTFTFQAAIADTAELYVIHYERDGGQGDVILTNPDNAQKNTHVTNVTLVADSAKGTDSQLLLPGSNPVTLLGTGTVYLYGTSDNPGLVNLRTGGDTTHPVTLSSLGSTYLIENAFVLNEYTGILQTGGNSHTLTGDILVNTYGSGDITNDSTSALYLDSDITVSQNASLTLNADAGAIVLGGNKSLDAVNGSLSINGSSGVLLTDGYVLSVDTLTLQEDAFFSADGGSVLNVGSGGISPASGATIVLRDATYNALASSTLSTSLDLESTGDTASVLNVASADSILYLEGGISGSGNLVKTGEGKLIIAASNLLENDAPASSTTGAVILQQGSLQLGQSGNFLSDGTTTIPASYQLKGGLDIQSGTLTGMIDGNGNDVHFGGSSVFSLGIDASSLSSSLLSAGSITVDQGATVKADFLGQDWLVDTDYVIISSQTGIQGADFLLDASANFALVDVALSQTDSEVLLKLSIKVPEPVVHTPNEDSVKTVVDNIATEVLNNGGRNIQGELLDLMQKVSKMTESDYEAFISDTALSTSSLYSAMAGRIHNMRSHMATTRNRVAQLDPAIFHSYSPEGTQTLWAQGIANHQTVKSTNNAPGYRMNTWGGDVGTAFSLSPEALIGIGFNYMSGDVKLKEGYGDNKTDTYNLDLFTRYKEDRFSLTAVLAMGLSEVKYTRHLHLPNETLTSTGSTRGPQVMALVEGAYDIYLNDSHTSTLQPLVNVTAGYAQFQSYNEAGMGNAGYHIDAQDFQMTTLGAGVRYIYTQKNEISPTPYRFELRAIATQDVGDSGYTITANYLGAPMQTMTVQGVPQKRTAFVVGASGVVPVSRNISLFADVNGEVRNNQNSVGASMGVNIQF